MKAFSYSEARQRLSELLNIARNEEVIIKRRGGETFSLQYRKSTQSPFAVPGMQTKATTEDILAAVREVRAGSPERKK
jgi:prevent-host-death family protein